MWITLHMLKTHSQRLSKVEKPVCYMFFQSVFAAIAIYLGWLSCAALIGFNKVLIHASGVDPVTATYVCLGILNAALLVWFVLETFALDKHLRY